MLPLNHEYLHIADGKGEREADPGGRETRSRRSWYREGGEARARARARAVEGALRTCDVPHVVSKRDVYVKKLYHPLHLSLSLSLPHIVSLSFVNRLHEMVAV